MQISLVTLLSEDNMNPLLRIMKLLGYADKKKSLPQSTHWYIENQRKKMKTDETFQSKKKIDNFSMLVAAETRQNSKLMGRSKAMRAIAKKKIQLDQIYAMHLQIAQLQSIKIKICDLELL